MLTQNQETKVTPLEKKANSERSAIISELKDLKAAVEPGASAELAADQKLVQRAQFNHEWDTKYYSLVNKGATLFDPTLHDALHARVNEAEKLKIKGNDFPGELQRFKDFGERANNQSEKSITERTAALENSKKLGKEAETEFKAAKTPEEAKAAVEKFIKAVETLLPVEKKPVPPIKPAGTEQSMLDMKLPRFSSIS